MKYKVLPTNKGYASSDSRVHSSVLILDGDAREAIAIVRSLGKKGIEVTVGVEKGKIAPAFMSKYASRKISYHSPDLSPKFFLNDLSAIIKENKYSLLLPVRDTTTMLVSKHKDSLSHYTNIPVADYHTWIKARDKGQTLKIAMNNGIPTPKTYFVENNYVDIEKIRNEIGFPAIIKPHKSSGSRGIKYIKSAEELSHIYNDISRKYGQVMIQEFIPHGGAYGVSVLFNKGEQIASFTYKRLREYPISGGPSTLRESIRYPEIEQYASDLLRALNWHGVAMVEFRVDARDGKPKLMEINPRFWTGLPLAIYAGVDFPYLLYKMSINGHCESVFNNKIGVKARWFFGDLLWFLSSPDRFKTPSFFKFIGENMTYDELSLTDPMPAMGLMIDGLLSFINKGRREYVFNRGIDER